MLVLMRGRGQRVLITLPDGREVAVEVTDFRRKVDGSTTVWLGFTGPLDVKIDREEIVEKRRWLGESPGGGERP